jgi:hypothetical protein
MTTAYTGAWEGLEQRYALTPGLAIRSGSVADDGVRSLPVNARLIYRRQGRALASLGGSTSSPLVSTASTSYPGSPQSQTICRKSPDQRPNVRLTIVGDDVDVEVKIHTLAGTLVETLTVSRASTTTGTATTTAATSMSSDTVYRVDVRAKSASGGAAELVSVWLTEEP